MAGNKDNESFSAKEAKERFEAALCGGHKPMASLVQNKSNARSLPKIKKKK
jgi:hypothetical protein